MASSEREDTPGGLDGIRVLEVGGEAIDFCGSLLAGEGADVIKIEPPEGTASRSIGPFLNDVRDKNRSLFFWAYNRGKRSITLDLNSHDDQERYAELVRTADVILDGTSIGCMETLSLGYDQMQEAAGGRLIYCSITPFGLSGPWKDFKSSDLIHQALGGSAYCIGYTKNESGGWDTPPFMAQSWHSYAIACEHAAVAIAAAIFHRDSTGRGQLIDVSIHDACAQATEATIPRYVYTKRNQVRSTPQQMKCGDGRYLALVVTMLRNANVPKLRELLSTSGLSSEIMDFGKDRQAVAEATNRLAAVLKKWVATKSAVDAFNALQPCGVICAPVRPPEELIQDAQCVHRQNFVEILHEDVGRTFTYPRHPSLRSETPWKLNRRAPLLGEHTDEIFQELLRKQRAA